MGIALVVIGPKKLPELARSIGKGLAELKRAASDLHQDINAESKAQEEKERLEKINQAVAGESAPHADADDGAAAGDSKERSAA